MYHITNFRFPFTDYRLLLGYLSPVNLTLDARLKLVVGAGIGGRHPIPIAVAGGYLDGV